MSQVETKLGQTVMIMTKEKSAEDSQLSKVTKDSSKLSIDQVNGLITQVIKQSLFNGLEPS